MNGDLFDTMFKWGMGIGGALVSAVTLGAGRKIIALDRENGEHKERMDALNQRLDRMESKLDRVIEKIAGEGGV
jgi:hypothetical protein